MRSLQRLVSGSNSMVAVSGAAARCALVVGTYEHVLISYEVVADESKGGDASSLRLLFTDTSHCGSIRAVALSSGGVVASGGVDEVVQLFDLSANVELGSLMRHAGTITHVEFFDAYLFSGSEDGAICIWKTSNWECLRSLRGHKGKVNHFAVHPTGKLLLSVGEDKTLRAWNLLTAKCAYVTNIKVAADVVRWSPCGALYAVAYDDRVDVWDVSTGAISRSVAAGGPVHAMAFLSRRKLVVGCETGAIRAFDVASGAKDHEEKVEGNRVKCLSVVVNGRLGVGAAAAPLVAAASNDGAIVVFAAAGVDDDRPCVLRRVAEAKTALRPICIAAAEVGGSAVADDGGAAAVAAAASAAVVSSRMKRPAAAAGERRSSGPADQADALTPGDEPGVEVTVAKKKKVRKVVTANARRDDDDDVESRAVKKKKERKGGSVVKGAASPSAPAAKLTVKKKKRSEVGDA